MANDRQHILEIHRCCTRIIEESRTINNDGVKFFL